MPIARHMLTWRIARAMRVRTLGSALLLAGVGGLSDQYTTIRFPRRRECAGLANERQPDPTVSLHKTGTRQYGVLILAIPGADSVIGTTPRRGGGRILPGRRAEARAGRHLPLAFSRAAASCRGGGIRSAQRGMVRRPPPPARWRYSALNSSVHRWYAMIISWETLGFRRDIICRKSSRVRCRGFCRSSPSTGSL